LSDSAEGIPGPGIISPPPDTGEARPVRMVVRKRSEAFRRESEECMAAVLLLTDYLMNKRRIKKGMDIDR
jgi:hypothetical protein